MGDGRLEGHVEAIGVAEELIVRPALVAAFDGLAVEGLLREHVIAGKPLGIGPSNPPWRQYVDTGVSDHWPTVSAAIHLLHQVTWPNSGIALNGYCGQRATGTAN